MASGTDSDLFARISALAQEEKALLHSHGDGSGLSEGERARLREIEVELDRAYDLLRQREARRDAGLDPDLAEERSADVVEGYLS